MQQRHCKICQKILKGRRDKIFCSTSCKNEYHSNILREATAATAQIDKILHRNRHILLELLGNDGNKRRIHRSELDKKKFNYQYHTHLYVNSNEKTYYYIYEMGWMEFSNQEVLIVKC